MKIVDRTLSAWQTAILLFVILFANKILVLPPLLYEGAKLEAVFIPVLCFLLEMGLLWLFYRVKTQFPHQSFSQVVRDHCGKVVKILLFALFAVFFLSKAVLLYNVAFIFFRNLIYKDSGNFLILFCLLPVINHLCICGLRTMGRTLQLFFPLILIVCAFCVLVGVFGIGQGPLMYQGTFVGWLTTALKHISPYGDTIFLFLIMDKVQIGKGKWKIVFWLAALAGTLVVAITLVFILSYTYVCFLHPYAIFDIMSFVKEYGGLGRIDIISMALIIIFTYFQLAIYMKAFLCAFDVLFPRLNQIYGVLSFNVAFLIVVNFFIVNLETAIVYGEKILPFAMILPYLLLPAVLLAVKFMQKYRHDVVESNRQKFLFQQTQLEKNKAHEKELEKNKAEENKLENDKIDECKLEKGKTDESEFEKGKTGEQELQNKKESEIQSTNGSETQNTNENKLQETNKSEQEGNFQNESEQENKLQSNKIKAHDKKSVQEAEQ